MDECSARPDAKIVSSEFHDLGVLEDLKIPRCRGLDKGTVTQELYGVLM
jgi:hypothetical protein